MYQRILPMAWELTEDLEREYYPLYVPTPCRQILQHLARVRAQSTNRSFLAVPVRSLDTVVTAALPETILTLRNGWQRDGVPWLVSSEPVDLAELPFLLREWVLEEFGSLPDSVLAEARQVLRSEAWRWGERIRIPMRQKVQSPAGDLRFHAIPDLLAKEFLKANPSVRFGGNRPADVVFHRVARVGYGADLMSWPPTEVPWFRRNPLTGEPEEVGQGPASMVIRFETQTVPWRDDPVTYVRLSERRWQERRLSDGEVHYIPRGGVTAYVGTKLRLLDAQSRPFAIVALPLRVSEQGPYWPRAIAGLVADERMPDPLQLAMRPAAFMPGSKDPVDHLQAAIAYDVRLGTHRLNAGVTAFDLVTLDNALKERLPVRRAGTGERVALTMPDEFWDRRKLLDPEGNEKNEPAVPMLRAHVSSPAAFGPSHPPIRSIAILWDSEDWRNAVRDELVKQLGATNCDPHAHGSALSGPHGSIQVIERHVGDLGAALQVGGVETPRRERHRRRIAALEQRIPRIAALLPESSPSCIDGALVEIMFRTKVREQDPKLAWRLGLVQAGYVNQHMYPLSVVTADKELQALVKSPNERVSRAVSDLLRQLGALPAPLISVQADGLAPDLWLLALWVLRRTRRVTADGKPMQQVIMIRTNPLTGYSELTTPQLLSEDGQWLPYSKGLGLLTREKWDPEVDANDFDSASKAEEELLNRFVVDCIRDSLYTSIGATTQPKVLFMAEAMNARLKLKWLQNTNLPWGRLPDPIANGLAGDTEAGRVWVVRVRLPETGEVPAYVPGSADEAVSGTTKGLFRWAQVCDQPDRFLYLSIGKQPVTAKHLARKGESRFDDGERNTFTARPLEIAPIHYAGISPERLAFLVHALRHRWPYTDGPTALPLPFHFARQAVQYAVSSRDWVEVADALGEDEDMDEAAD